MKRLELFPCYRKHEKSSETCPVDVDVPVLVE
jgi:hypothetical protein